MSDWNAQLAQAVLDRNLDMVRKALAAGADPNHVVAYPEDHEHGDMPAMTMLGHCVCQSVLSVPIAESLIEAGAHGNDPITGNAYYNLARWGQTQLVERLVNLGRMDASSQTLGLLQAFNHPSIRLFKALVAPGALFVRPAQECLRNLGLWSGVSHLDSINQSRIAVAFAYGLKALSTSGILPPPEEQPPIRWVGFATGLAAQSPLLMEPVVDAFSQVFNLEGMDEVHDLVVFSKFREEVKKSASRRLHQELEVEVGVASTPSRKVRL